jgi:hypothetical protein
MNALRIDAASPESAYAMMEALRGFDARLIEDGERQQVVVSLGPSPHRIVDVLNALERYVTARGDGPARIELEGRHYTLHPEPTD